nr:hypothetical protein [Crucivirus sp.]
MQDASTDPFLSLAGGSLQNVPKGVPPLDPASTNAVSPNPNGGGGGVYVGTAATAALNGLPEGFVALANPLYAGNTVRVATRWMCQNINGTFISCSNAGLDTPTGQGVTVVANDNPSGTPAITNVQTPVPSTSAAAPVVMGAGAVIDVKVPRMGSQVTILGTTYTVTPALFAAGLIGILYAATNLIAPANAKMYLDISCNVLGKGEK